MNHSTQSLSSAHFFFLLLVLGLDVGCWVHQLCCAVLPRSKLFCLSPIMGCFRPYYLNTWNTSQLEAVVASKNKIEKEGTGHDLLMQRWHDNDI
jgi:hypothetical protein